MARFILLHGIPDKGYYPIGLKCRDQVLEIKISGTADFATHLPDLMADAVHIWLPILPGDNIDIPRFPVVNHIADPDYYDFPLRQAAEIVNILKTPCFNHPVAIRNASRERLGHVLRSIDKLIVPRCIRFKPARPEDFQIAVIENELSYPVIVRLCGTHGGETQQLIYAPQSWDLVHKIPWGGSEVFVCEFNDYRDSDGWFRKQRVIVIGDTIIPRHGCAKMSWSISGHNSPSETLQHELEWNETFYRKSYPLIKDTIYAISRAIGLDYFGIDYSLRPNGKMLIFEVSACMSLLSPYGEQSHSAIEDFPEKAKSKLKQLLLDPKRWRVGS